jgi:predicted LPLAT superfamily acyltransferase
MTGERWSSRSLGSRFKHEIFYLLIRRAGPWAAYFLLYPVVFWYTLKILVSRGPYPYLKRRFPMAGPVVSAIRAFRLNLAFGRVLVDRATLGLTGRAEFIAPPEALETLNSLLAEGRGLLILTAHVGAWQTALAWLGRTEAPVNIVWLRQEADLDRHYFEHGFQGAAPKIIDSADPGPAMAAAASALLSGEIVCFMADRMRPEETFTARAGFLGTDMSLPGGPFFLAARLGSPLAVIFTWRLGIGRAAGRIFKIIRPEETRHGLSVQPLAESFTAALTDFVFEHPFQFFNFHDLWSD